jgi:hypothetical protein
MNIIIVKAFWQAAKRWHTTIMDYGVLTKIMSYNQNLDKFLMFYSQSDAGNGLTRGLENEIARKTYGLTMDSSQLSYHSATTS